MTFFLHIAASSSSSSSDLFTIGQSLLTHLGQLLGIALLLFGGGKALHHISRDRPAAALALALTLLLPAWFIFSPNSAESALKGALSAIGA